jgi:radical SAM family uncharacterized protein/radical SAM-linked protein
MEPVEIDHLLPRVLKPSRYVANERNIIRNEWREDRTTVALCFPEVYEIGMSNNGMKILYHLINRRDEALAERVYCPWPDMEREMRRDSASMFSHESRMPLRAFDMIGFSLSYELTYTNVLTVLDLAGIPLHASDRTEEHPLILGGGTTMANPEPMAQFFDAFLVGDGEEAIDRIVDVVGEHRSTGGTRRDLLLNLMQIDGIYVPEFYDVDYNEDGSVREFKTLEEGAPFPVRRHIIAELKPEYAPTKPLVPVTEIAQDRLGVEVLRGCTQGCRFCQAGYFYRPVRERTPEQVIDIADQGITSGGWNDISLMSLSTADHSRAEELVERVAGAFKERGVSIALPSLRADRLSVNLCESAGEVKKNGFTFAPETGSERLRRVINKSITNEQMRGAAQAAYSKGWRLIKLYFMIGLPTETMEDVQSIIDISNEIAAIGRAIRPDTRVNASVGPFAPRPFTPFQWAAFEDVTVLDERLRYIQKNLTNRAIKLKWHAPDDIWLEAILSRGDRRLGAVIEDAWNNGARFDSWNEFASLERWKTSFATVGLEPANYLRERSLDEVLPWEIIDIGVTRKFLELEWKRATSETPTPDCRWDNCNACGIPGMPYDNKLTTDIERVLLDVEKSADQPTDTEFTLGGNALPGDGIGGGTYRVRYSVGETFRFVGHSDLMRTIHRSFEIARLPVAMSQGYTPRPKAGFGPPVPHGCTSDNEFFDVELTESVGNLVDTLNDVLPDGLNVHHTSRISGKTEAISAAICAAEYVITIPTEAASTEIVQSRMQEFEQVETWEAARVNAKGKSRIVDLKRAIISHTLNVSESSTQLTVVGRLNDPDGHNVNPAFVLAELLGLDEDSVARVKLHRADLYGRLGHRIADMTWIDRRPRHLHTKSREFAKFLDS